ncbi:hypothetical protein Bca101_036320 [Brassica carinata]
MSALVAGSQVRSAWAAVWLIMLSLGLAAGGAYLVYKYRLRVSFSPPFSLPCGKSPRLIFLFLFCGLRCVLKHCHVSLVSQQYMDSEIRAIMAQYMPLDSQPEVPNHVNDERA